MNAQVKRIDTNISNLQEKIEKLTEEAKGWARQQNKEEGMKCLKKRKMY